MTYNEIRRQTTNNGFTVILMEDESQAYIEIFDEYIDEAYKSGYIIYDMGTKNRLSQKFKDGVSYAKDLRPKSHGLARRDSNVFDKVKQHL